MGNDPGSFLIQYGALGKAVDDVLMCHKTLTGEKEGLENFLQKLHAVWYGGGHDNYTNTQNDWNNACDEVNGILLQLANALTTALDNYYNADVNIQKLWGG